MPDVGFERKLLLIETGSAPAATPVERLAIPKDDSTPHSPVVSFAQCQLEAVGSNVTSSANLLGLGQFGGAIGEEPVVISFRTTSSVFLNFY